MQLVSAISAPNYFDLPTAKFFVAQNANPLVIERSPRSKVVGIAQDQQPIV